MGRAVDAQHPVCPVPGEGVRPVARHAARVTVNFALPPKRSYIAFRVSSITNGQVRIILCCIPSVPLITKSRLIATFHNSLNIAIE
jgi:hypothetical protein